MSAYYGEFSDDHVAEMERDAKIEILNVEDGEFGLDQGTKKVEFAINTMTDTLSCGECTSQKMVVEDGHESLVVNCAECGNRVKTVYK